MCLLHILQVAQLKRTFRPLPHRTHNVGDEAALRLPLGVSQQALDLGSNLGATPHRLGRQDHQVSGREAARTVEHSLGHAGPRGIADSPSAAPHHLPRGMLNASVVDVQPDRCGRVRHQPMEMRRSLSAHDSTCAPCQYPGPRQLEPPTVRGGVDPTDDARQLAGGHHARDHPVTGTKGDQLLTRQDPRLSLGEGYRRDRKTASRYHTHQSRNPRGNPFGRRVICGN